MSEEIAVLGIEVRTNSVAEGTQKLDKLTEAGGKAEKATNALKSAFVGLAGAMSIREMSAAVESWQTLNAQLNIATGSMKSGAEAYQQVVKMATATGQSLESIGMVYSRLAQNASQIGISQQKVADTTMAISKAMALSGGSAASAQAALTQFNQALASGTLRGEELNSILEQAPRRARALADGLGVPIGKLHELGEQGKITSDLLVNALGSQSAKLSKEFEQLPLTMSRALQNLKTEWVDTMGSFESSTGAFGTAAKGIDAIAKNMDTLAIAGAAVAAVYGGKMVSSIVAATTAKIADAAATARLNEASIAAAITSKQLSGVMMGQSIAATEAAKSMAVAANASAAASGLARGAITALGGPIGIVTTALTLGATAWMLWGNKTEEATKTATNSAIQNLDSVIAKIEEMNGRLDQINRKVYNNTLQSAESKAKTVAAQINFLQNKLDALDTKGGSGRFSTEGQAAQQELNALAQREIVLQAELGKARADSANVGTAAIKKYVNESAVGADAVRVKQEKTLNEFASAIQAAGGVLDLSNADHKKAYDALNANLADAAKGLNKVSASVKNDAAEMMSARLEVIKNGLADEVDAIKFAVTVGDKTQTAGIEEVRIAQKAAHEARLAELNSALGREKDIGKQSQLLAKINEEKTAAVKDETAAKRDLYKLDKEYESFLNSRVAGIASETEALLQKAESAEFELQTIGLSAEQLAVLTARRYDEQIAIQQGEADRLRGIEGREAELYVIEQKIDALNRLKNTEITKPKLQEQAREWQKFSDDIERSLTDALMRGFESGKSFGENFVDSLKNSLKTSALKIVVNYVTGGAGQLVGTLGNAAINGVLGTSGNNGGAGNNYLGTASNMNTAYSAYNTAGIGYQYATGAMGGANAAGTLFANATGTGLDGLLATNSAFGTAAATETGWASLLGEAAYGAWVLAIPAIAGAIKSYGTRKAYEFDGVQIKGDYSGDNFTGAAATKWNADGGWWQNGDEKKVWTQLSADPALLLSQIFPNGTAGLTLPSNLADIGKNSLSVKMNLSEAIAAYEAGRASVPADNQYSDSYMPTDGGGLIYAPVGDGMPAVHNWATRGELGSKTPRLSTDPAMLGALDSAIDAIFAATKASFKGLADQFDDADLVAKINAFSAAVDIDTNSGDISKVLANLTDTVNKQMAAAFLPAIETLRQTAADGSTEAWSATLARVMTEVSGVTRLLDLMGTSLGEAFGKNNTNGVLTLVDGLAGMFGGIDNLNQSFSAYYANFFTAEEQRAQALEDMGKSFKALNLTMPTTRDGFRDLVEAQDLTTTSGQATFRALMDLQGGFAALTPTMEDAAKAVSDAAKAASEAANTLLTAMVDNALDRLQTSVDAEKAKVESAFESTTGALETAFEAAQTALEAQIDAAAETNAAIGTLANTLKSALGTLAVETDTLLLAQRAAAQASLDTAANAANRGLSLTPFADAIGGALETLAKPSEQLYGSFEDYARAQGIANASITLLSKNATAQKSVSDLMLSALKDSLAQGQSQFEQQVAALESANDAQLAGLDALVTDAKAQLDALKGIDTSVLSVKDAVLQMTAAIAALKTAAPAATGATTAQIVANYQNILGRAPDDAGLVYWSEQAAGGMSAATIASAFQASAENQVQDLYQNMLGRAPDAAGMEYWIDRIQSGTSMTEIAAGFAASDEYKNSHFSGLERVPYDGYKATLHAGEAVVDAQSTQALTRYFGGGGSGGSNNALANEISALREENKALREDMNALLRAVASSTNKTAKLLERAMPDGDALAIREAA